MSEASRQESDQNARHEEHDGYTGPATVRTEETEIEVEVVLRGHFQPIDGRFHWYGRVAANESVHRISQGRQRDVLLCTPHGEVVGKLSDPDPWDRYRIRGVGRPPFDVDVASTDL
jgi:hypothetical protein